MFPNAYYYYYFISKYDYYIYFYLQLQLGAKLINKSTALYCCDAGLVLLRYVFGILLRFIIGGATVRIRYELIREPAWCVKTYSRYTINYYIN